MDKKKSYNSVFFVRDSKDLGTFYQRVDFWVSLLSLVLIVLSLVLVRYATSGGGSTFSQMWKMTNGNWALAVCGIFSIIAMVYVFVINFIFRNSAMLSGINIGLGLLMAVSFIVEYLVLTKVGAYTEDGVTFTMGNTAGIGYYFGIIGSVIVVGLEFYKLGAQGYYTADDFSEKKSESGVQVVDGVVVIDGEKVEVKNEDTKEENKTNIRVLTEGEEQKEEKEQEEEKEEEKVSKQSASKSTSEVKSTATKTTKSKTSTAKSSTTKASGTSTKKTVSKTASDKASGTKKTTKKTTTNNESESK